MPSRRNQSRTWHPQKMRYGVIELYPSGIGLTVTKSSCRGRKSRARSIDLLGSSQDPTSRNERAQMLACLATLPTQTRDHRDQELLHRYLLFDQPATDANVVCSHVPEISEGACIAASHYGSPHPSPCSDHLLIVPCGIGNRDSADTPA